MKTLSSKMLLIKSILLSIALTIPSYVSAKEYYSSQLVNRSKHAGSNGFKLVKSKMWPNSFCVVDSGKDILYPGESTNLKIIKNEKCKESGIGYSIYRMEDSKNQHLLGYLSHRLGDGKFSIQISRFCENEQCVFTDLNPEQQRQNAK